MSDGEESAEGWDAIDAACQRLYGEQAPRHVGYQPGRAFGSVLQGCSAYRASDHWHYITYGMSNLFDEDEGENEGLSGWGYELTWRVRDPSAEYEAPGWPFTILQRLAKWAAETPVLLDEGARLVLNAPVTGFPHTDGPATALRGILLTEDPELGQMPTSNGSFRFLQFVGVTDEDLEAARANGARSVVDRLRAGDPLLVTAVGG